MTGESKRGLPLRPTLLSVVVLLILLAAGGVGALAYGSSSRIVDDLWGDLAEQLAHATTQRALRYFEPAPPYVELTRQQATSGRLDLGPFAERAAESARAEPGTDPVDGDPVGGPAANEDTATRARAADSDGSADAPIEPGPGDPPGHHPPTELLDHFRAAIEANPEFTWASWGGEDGTYVAVHRDPEGALRGVWRTATDTGTILRELVPSGDGWVLHAAPTHGDYDPRPRPWYRAAAAARDDGVWVEPFVFATVRQPGFMYARAHREGERLRGVWAVEYEMSDLSAFLATLEVGEHGEVYVLTSDGQVVGHPGGETTTEIDGELVVARAAGHPDAMLRRAWEARADANEGAFTAGPYLAMVERFPAETGIDWEVLVVVPEDDFFGDVRAQAWQTLAIGGLAALLAILFGAFFSNRVSGALRRIVTELERIGRFELEGEVASTQSFVREVNDMRDTTARMKRSLRSFGKYVPKEVVRELLLSGEEAALGGREEELTILFSDIAGFTTVAEKMAPDVLVEVLAEYLDGMSAAVRGEGGTVDKYIGDAVMAFWGAPRANPEHARAACEGALAMRAKLAEMQTGWDAKGLPRLDTRIGVNTGPVLVGNIGAPDRLNYTVMGDAVNLAARLEGLNKHYGTTILVGDATAEAVGDAMVFRPLEWVAVKGKDEAVLIHELVGRKGEVDAETVAAVGRYAEALSAYRDRRFEEAAAKFREAGAALGGDVSSERMAARCDEYTAAPPPDDWDGRTVMTTK
ncbi:MAG: hypothetical protein CMN31_08350 [Sandaracinus sp.]|nr:hypothetical protein [Sandaracinus sp.]